MYMKEITDITPGLLALHRMKLVKYVNDTGIWYYSPCIEKTLELCMVNRKCPACKQRLQLVGEKEISRLAKIDVLCYIIKSIFAPKK